MKLDERASRQADGTRRGRDGGRPVKLSKQDGPCLRDRGDFQRTNLGHLVLSEQQGNGRRVPLRSLKLVATNTPGQPLDSAIGESGGFHENTDGKWSLMLIVKR